VFNRIRRRVHDNRIAAYCRLSCFCIAYSDQEKVRNFFSFFYKTVVNVVVGISQSCASFCHFRTFSLLSETTSCFYNGILLLFFNNLRSAPARLPIKLTTVATILTVKLMYITICLLCCWWRNLWFHPHVAPARAQWLSAQMGSYSAIKDLCGGFTLPSLHLNCNKNLQLSL